MNCLHRHTITCYAALCQRAKSLGLSGEAVAASKSLQARQKQALQDLTAAAASGTQRSYEAAKQQCALLGADGSAIAAAERQFQQRQAIAATGLTKAAGDGSFVRFCAARDAAAILGASDAVAAAEKVMQRRRQQAAQGMQSTHACLTAVIRSLMPPYICQVLCCYAPTTVARGYHGRFTKGRLQQQQLLPMPLGMAGLQYSLLQGSCHCGCHKCCCCSRDNLCSTDGSRLHKICSPPMHGHGSFALFCAVRDAAATVIASDAVAAADQVMHHRRQQAAQGMHPTHAWAW